MFGSGVLSGEEIDALIKSSPRWAASQVPCRDMAGHRWDIAKCPAARYRPAAPYCFFGLGRTRGMGLRRDENVIPRPAGIAEQENDSYRQSLGGGCLLSESVPMPERGSAPRMSLSDLFKSLRKLTGAKSRNAEQASAELRVNIEEECPGRPFEMVETKGIARKDVRGAENTPHSKSTLADAGTDKNLAKRPTAGKITFNRDRKFDLQLDQALIDERRLAEIFAHANIRRTHELKLAESARSSISHESLDTPHQPTSTSGPAVLKACDAGLRFSRPATPACASPSIETGTTDTEYRQALPISPI